MPIKGDSHMVFPICIGQVPPWSKTQYANIQNNSGNLNNIITSIFSDYWLVNRPYENAKPHGPNMVNSLNISWFKAGAYVCDTQSQLDFASEIIFTVKFKILTGIIFAFGLKQSPTGVWYAHISSDFVFFWVFSL